MLKPTLFFLTLSATLELIFATSVILTEPKPNDIWETGSTVLIKWKATDEATGPITLQYATGPSQALKIQGIIASNVDYKAGKYKWKIPSTLKPKKYVIEASASETDISFAGYITVKKHVATTKKHTSVKKLKVTKKTKSTKKSAKKPKSTTTKKSINKKKTTKKSINKKKTTKKSINKKKTTKKVAKKNTKKVTKKTKKVTTLKNPVDALLKANKQKTKKTKKTTRRGNVCRGYRSDDDIENQHISCRNGKAVTKIA